MTIKFICGCGQHLRARDEMAARRSACPRCGAPVGIPSLQPTQAGTVAAPMTPDERRRHARQRALVSSVAPAAAPERPAPGRPRPRDADPIPVLTNREKRRRERAKRELEKTSSQCLLYPLYAWRLCL